MGERVGSTNVSGSIAKHAVHAAKCLWDDCKTCNSCSAAMLRKELAMDEAKDTPDACPNECLLTKGKTWVQKCDWKACKVCQNCQSLRSLYDVQGICPHT